MKKIDPSFLQRELPGSSAKARAIWSKMLIEQDADLEELLDLLSEKKTAIPFLWLISDLAIADPSKIKNWIPRLVVETKHLPLRNRAHSLSRYCLYCGITESIEGEMVDRLFKWALDPGTTQMTKRTSLEVLKNHLQIRPELKDELQSTLVLMVGKHSADFEKFRGKMEIELQKLP